MQEQPGKTQVDMGTATAGAGGQVRMGYDGEMISILLFRTMRYEKEQV